MTNIHVGGFLASLDEKGDTARIFIFTMNTMLNDKKQRATLDEAALSRGNELQVPPISHFVCIDIKGVQEDVMIWSLINASVSSRLGDSHRELPFRNLHHRGSILSDHFLCFRLGTYGHALKDELNG